MGIHRWRGFEIAVSTITTSYNITGSLVPETWLTTPVEVARHRIQGHIINRTMKLPYCRTCHIEEREKEIDKLRKAFENNMIEMGKSDYVRTYGNLFINKEEKQ